MLRLYIVIVFRTRELAPPGVVSIASGTARHGIAWHGMARHGTASHGTASHGAARHGMAWHGMARHGTAWHGTARHDMAWCCRNVVVTVESTHPCSSSGWIACGRYGASTRTNSSSMGMCSCLLLSKQSTMSYQTLSSSIRNVSAVLLEIPVCMVAA
jgi:hypothetical protein